jgi:oxygen-independent coproporphyrinogen-3 oxidase
VELEPDRIRVTPLGRIFIRNVAMVFDAYLSRHEGQTKVFSKTL